MTRAARAIVTGMTASVRAYQLAIAPMLGANCRFEPSCSHYAIEALRLHGPVHGTILTTKRILRCNPWHEGGFDPVPPPTHSPTHPAGHATMRGRTAP